MQFENAAQAVSAAIRSIFQRWTALKLVVEHHMGGNSDEANDLMEVTLSMATSSSKRHDEDDFIDFFYDAFDRMHCDIEDGSPEEIASQIVRVRDAAMLGDFGPAMQLASKANATNDGAHLRSVDGGEAFVCEGVGESKPERRPKPERRIKQAMIMDDDGFTQVTKNGRH